jgi:SAM-dependent methyltransferase
VLQPLPRVALRGAGPRGQLGVAAREAQAAANRPLFLGALPREYLPSVPEVRAVLEAGGRVADIGCGFGWSAIGLALAHPSVTVDGFDVDVPSVEAARRNAAEAGVADRVGIVLVMDERVAEAFTAPGDEIEQLMYGYSLTCCLPDGMAHADSVGTGTVMRPDTLRRYAAAAGFARVEVLPVEDAFFRFYRLA